MSFDEGTAMANAAAGNLTEAYRLLARPTTAPSEPADDAQRRVALGSVLLELGRPRDALALLAQAGTAAGAWEITKRRARAEALLAQAMLPEDPSAPPEDDDQRGEAVHGLLAAAWPARRRAGDGVVSRALTTAAQTALASGAFGDVAVAVHHMGRFGVARAARPWWDVPVEGPLLGARLRYTMALVMHDPTALAEAGEAFEAAGARLYAAEAFHELSRMADRLADRRAAVQRARLLVASCQGAVTPALLFATGTHPLSRREREIAALAIGGLSDRAIAERLSLSVRTIQNHMYRVYQKLGVHGRRSLRGSQVVAGVRVG
jgi:DNA-binding CsgD family transcriptional regulator